MIPIVFLPGIGDGGISGAWRDALKQAVRAAGYPGLADQQFVAPRYTAPLKEYTSSSAHPPKWTTTKLPAADADRERWEYERRQASLERLLSAEGSRDNLFEIPQWFVEQARKWFAEANGYVRDQGRRNRILNYVLDSLPVPGEAVIVGHSLGSLIAIDLLDHLPQNFTVRRLVTIGSPAGHVAMHHPERLLRTFPLSRVKSWVNLWSTGDQVPFGKGIGQLFPQALDVRIDLGLGEHSAEKYLSHRTAAVAVGDAIFGSLSREIAPVETAVDCPLSEHEKAIVVGLAYGHLLADELAGDAAKQARYRAALDDVQRSVIAATARVCNEERRAVPKGLAMLADGRRPGPGSLLDVRDSAPVMLSVASHNVIAPYEIDVGKKASKKALEHLAEFLVYPSSRGASVYEALMTARKTVNPNSLWPRILLAVVGGVLLLAAPVGLALAAPAGLGGGAAIVAALAAFGPGGMVGGLVTAAALASAGAGTTVAAALASSSSPPEMLEAALVQQLATAIARAALKDPRDDESWSVLSNLETEIARELQRLQPYSDEKAPIVKSLQRKAAAVRRTLSYMVKKGLVPGLVSNG